MKKDKRFRAVSILLTITFGMLVVSPIHAEVVTNTIPVGGHQLNTLAYDSGKGEIFVSDQVNGISIISDNSNAVIANVTDTPTGVNGMAYDSGKNEIFVTSWATNNVCVISDDTNTVTAYVAVGDKPLGVAYDYGKGEVFVANSINDSVSVISDNTNSVVATINVGNVPSGIAYDPIKDQIYVTNEDSDTVSVISDNTNTVVATVPVVHEPCGLAFDSGKGEIFVASSASNVMSVISDKTNTVVASVTGATSLSLNGVAYDPKKEEVFVTNFDYDTVSVIADSNNTVVATVSVGDQPYGIIYDSSDGELFVTNYSQGTLSVIYDSVPSTELHYLGDITINSDGTVSPPSAPIQKSGDSYVLTSDVDGSITVEKSNMLFNGNGFTVNGMLQIGSLPTVTTVGNPLISDVTIQNLIVTGSNGGIELWQASNVIVANNTITETGNFPAVFEGGIAGIDVEGGGSNMIIGNNVSHNYNAITFIETESNLILENNITNNHNPYLVVSALMFWSSSNNTVYHNNFLNNTSPAGDANDEGAPFSGNIWDDGFPAGGNYWGNQTGKEIGTTGISDTPYIIDSQNKDRYPLIQPFSSSFLTNYEQEVAPPKVSAASPLNKTYSKTTISLTFQINKPFNWAGYSLDGQSNVTINGNITISNIGYGSHSIMIYANSTFGVIGASKPIDFSVVKPEPFASITAAVVSVIVIAIVIGLALTALYRRRHRKIAELSER